MPSVCVISNNLFKLVPKIMKFRNRIVSSKSTVLFFVGILVFEFVSFSKKNIKMTMKKRIV